MLKVEVPQCALREPVFCILCPFAHTEFSYWLLDKKLTQSLVVYVNNQQITSNDSWVKIQKRQSRGQTMLVPHHVHETGICPLPPPKKHNGSRWADDLAGVYISGRTSQSAEFSVLLHTVKGLF